MLVWREGHCWQKLNKKELVNSSQHQHSVVQKQMVNKQLLNKGSEAISRLRECPTIWAGSAISNQWGGASSHLTSFPSKLVKTVLLEKYFPLGRHTDFQSLWLMFNSVRKISFCIPAAEERINFRCLQICWLPLLLWQQTSYKERSIFTHSIPNRAFQPLDILQTCFSRHISLSWVWWLILLSQHMKSSDKRVTEILRPAMGLQNNTSKLFKK